ncbi:hypothetical protein OHB49_45195 (plasmid) [Streptomyces sp. NBC_01717]|uniref:hypothetical protein n=1 Tax=Streptomyces sp. NBC_01717 TaxID=2975918 RepID=UPI002E31D674|nr:hypothetical protein [Streptomyces sp. NBC_01717]
MTDASKNTPIQNRYAQQFAADREANHKEQESIAAQITELQGRLKQLKADEVLLSDMQGLVGPPAEQQSAPALLKTDALAEAAPTQAVPPPRHKTVTKTTAAASRGKKTARAKAPGKVTQSAPKKAAAKKTATKTDATNAAEPSLSELVLGLLLAHAGEPRITREVHADLETAHPKRATTIQTVRNILDSLANKKIIEKEKKQGSAMYTAPKPTKITPTTETATDNPNKKTPATAQMY